ncbi:hypothetical protein AAV94_02455 [Lampropedia cohaerens]|uniref:BadM/Rrf2 family transcriptional regulator n=1 Tax=Lampropedia cohaerens TaxID=1610491 RepID=A0A0U1Q223_9BURK|nr:Rrf2 family transcriptional regulator [Lampropedia cohaerens]KKW68824.1 hypothetical protein AAV94_02455 [Lampropedia cohaerens]
MKLTLKTDFAFRTLLYLGRQQTLVSIAEVASYHGISRNHLVKVVHELGQHGFIETVRGKHGGIRLAEKAWHSTAGDVVRAMEEDLALVVCFEPLRPQAPATTHATGTCRYADQCGLQHTLAQALDAFMRELDRTPLARLLRPVHQAGEHRITGP